MGFREKFELFGPIGASIILIVGVIALLSVITR